MRNGAWVLILVLMGTTLPAPAGPMLIYTDRTKALDGGLPGVLTESLAWGDYDNDGDEDLYLTNDGPNVLLRNDGNDQFTDVTATTGVGHAGWSVGTAFGDLDNDGDLDLYVVSFNSGPDVLYRNDGPIGPGGEHTFTDVTAAAGVVDETSSRGMAFLDYNRDGRLDIVVNAIGPDILYENQGGLTFTNVAPALGVATEGQGVGVVPTDLDGNGWVDLFTGNRSGLPNRLYLNHLGSFTDITTTAGISAVGLGMGVHAFDYDNDLDFDLYWTAWPGAAPGQPNALYENVDGTSFVEVAAASGTADVNGWGISNNAGDVDNDGWEDFVLTNGFSDLSTANVLFLNNGDRTFSDVTSLIGGGAFDGRGAALADYDGDGDLDLCVTADIPQPTRLWRNDSNNDHQWLTVKLVGTCSNRSGFGARIEVATDRATTVKEVAGGAGRGSFNSLPVEFGLGAASTIHRILIRWPSGVTQALTGMAPGQILSVTEPCGSLSLFVATDGLLWAHPHSGEVFPFDIVRGDLGSLHTTGGDFASATEICLSHEHEESFLASGASPAPGDGWWYLVRDLPAAGGGSFDEPSGTQVGSRDAGIDLSPGDCLLPATAG